MPPPTLITRRRLLQTGALASGALALGPGFWRRAVASPATPADSPYGPLRPADMNGLELPEGFRSRLVARGGEVVGATGYRFPILPDAQATFGLRDGGWLLVTNAEVPGPDAGVSALRFDPAGRITSAYRILGQSRLNCGGGATPWGTWLSCEEYDEYDEGLDLDPHEAHVSGRGAVWECDPTQPSAGRRRPAMGMFKHESVAVDPAGQRLYMTEDNADGAFYRFTPEDYPTLDSGTLEVALVRSGGRVEWLRVPQPAASLPHRQPKHQVRAFTKFDRGEGLWFDSGIVYVATTGDGKVHAYDTGTETLTVIYDERALAEPPLRNVDTLCVAPSGDLFATEDNDFPDAIGLALLTPDREISRFLRAVGPKHTIADPERGMSELTGPIFDPSGRRLYVSSQRARAAPNGWSPAVGEVYEITGPFRLAAPLLPDPPRPVPVNAGRTVEAGHALRSGQAQAAAARLVGPALGIELPGRVRADRLRRSGLPVALTLDEPASVDVRVHARFGAAPAGRRRRPEPRRRHRLGGVRSSFDTPGHRVVYARIPEESLARIGNRRGSLRLEIEIALTDRDGRADRLARTVMLDPARARSERA
jgi:uncharacterized protein